MFTTGTFSFKAERILLILTFIFLGCGCGNNTQQEKTNSVTPPLIKDSVPKAPVIAQSEETLFTKADIEQFKNNADSIIQAMVSKKISYVLKVDTFHGDAQRAGYLRYFYSDSLEETVVGHFGLNRPNIVSFDLLIYKYASATSASNAMDKTTIPVLEKRGIASPDSYFFRIKNYVLFLKTPLALSGGIHDNLANVLHRLATRHHNPSFDFMENHYKSSRITNIGVDPISGKWHFEKLMSMCDGDTVTEVANYDSTIEITDTHVTTSSYTFTFKGGWKTLMHGVQNYFKVQCYAWENDKMPNRKLNTYKGDITYYSISPDTPIHNTADMVDFSSRDGVVMISDNELCFIKGRVLYLYKKEKHL